MEAVHSSSLAARPLMFVKPEPLAPASAENVASFVAAARDGDRAAFGQLYQRYAPMVHAVLLARVERDAASDLVQDVFLTALERLSALHDVRAFGGWLAAIARNRAVDHRRSRRETVELPEDLAAREAAPAAEALDAGRALNAIRELPDSYSETLLLRLVHGLSGPEISELTGLTPGSVRVNLHRGMKLLREKLAEESRS
ncbi:MAG: RNA polymerase sigma factor [Candidatus Eiseniibacteriota bacterium]